MRILISAQLPRLVDSLFVLFFCKFSVLVSILQIYFGISFNTELNEGNEYFLFNQKIINQQVEL